ncbi:MAG: transposase [Gemmiger formicilis]|uniref:transposase n=1 Tax=Gemmiger formicilis TaxID=745368 RepID=UPI0039A2DB72
MPRKARKLSSCGVYHIMIRGINRMTIFNDDADNLNFLHILDFCADENFIIMAYCLMGNHLHLLAKDCNDSLQHMMKAIGVRYVAYYNRRYQRTGPLFQGRYKSQPVTTKGYFLRVLRHIHRNPVAAGMVQDMQDYPWSSYIDYFASRKKPLCHVDTSYALALRFRLAAALPPAARIKCPRHSGGFSAASPLRMLSFVTLYVQRQAWNATKSSFTPNPPQPRCCAVW